MAAAAPSAVDAGQATAAAQSSGTAASAAPAGFDAILVLQSLAATAEMADTAAFEAGDTADGLATEDSDDEENELETSLAFLSALISAASPQGSTNGSGGDLESGSGEQGAFDDGALPLAIKADAGLGLGADDATGKSEDLLGLAPLPETIEQRTGGDASQNLARAAELLAQAQRPGAAEAGKSAVLTHARDPRWADDFGARVSLMIRAGESTASLQLTPVDLGPVEVNVTVKDSQASIHFGASQAETRALIEASLPKLRELLASQGFSLMDSSVSSGFSRSQQSAFASGNRAGSEAETSTAENRPLRAMGLLDLYA
jgi:flagellar hook-length control protein FliK